MTPSEMAQALRIRRLREKRAAEVLHQARALEQQASNEIAYAESALVAFDENLKRQMQAFMDRASEGINPGAIENMRGFHADQLAQREGFLIAIDQAYVVLEGAQAAANEARIFWQRKSQAAENLQDLQKISTQDAARESALRAEMDMDETFGARAGNRSGG